MHTYIVPSYLKTLSLALGFSLDKACSASLILTHQPFSPFACFFQSLFPWISLLVGLPDGHLQFLACVGSSPSPPGNHVNTQGLPSKLSHLLFQLRIHPCPLQQQWNTYSPSSQPCLLSLQCSRLLQCYFRSDYHVPLGFQCLWK